MRKAEAPPFRVPQWAYTLAASLLVALLAYPAWLGIFRVPGVSEPGLELRDWSGSANLWVLTDTRRDGAARTVINLKGPFLLLASDFGIPEKLAPTGTLVFELFDDKGAIARSTIISVSEARSQSLRNGVVAVVFPAEALDAGAYRLQIRSAAEPEREVLFDVPVQLRER